MENLLSLDRCVNQPRNTHNLAGSNHAEWVHTANCDIYYGCHIRKQSRHTCAVYYIYIRLLSD